VLRIDSWTDLSDEKDDLTILYSGELKKLSNNTLKSSKLLTFVLFRDGSLHYYKDKIMHRG
jgi:hypothetical protein